MTSGRGDRLTGALERARSFVLPVAGSALQAASSPMHFPRPDSPGLAITTPEAMRARSGEWQKRILELAELVPELAGTGSMVEGSVSRVKFIAKGGTAASRKWLQQRLDALDTGRAARLIFYVGDAFIAWPMTGELDEAGNERMPYSLSMDEYNPFKSPPSVKNYRGAFVEQVDPTFRVWKPGLRNRYEANSAHKAVLELAEAMYVHQIADGSVANSRLMGAGLLIWPTELASKGIDPDTGMPYPQSQEELLGHFHRAAMQARSDQSSKDASLPFVTFVDAIDGKPWMPELLRLDKDDRASEYAERFGAYRDRYALAIDLPIEQVTGMGSTNHWSAWAIREDSWRSYLAPIVELLRDGLEKRVAAPFGMTIEVDARDLIAKTDVTDVVMQLVNLQVVTTESALLALERSDLTLLVSQVPPAAPGAATDLGQVKPPSDFKVNGSRGGGKYREKP